MIIIELPIVYPTEDYLEKLEIGVKVELKVDSDSMKTTFYVPDGMAMTVSDTSNKDVSILTIDGEMVYYVECDYDTLNCTIGNAIKKAESGSL